MKRFGIGAAVGFVVVFGIFYLTSMQGEAGQNAFDALISPSKETSNETPVPHQNDPVTVLKEPSVQDSATDLHADVPEQKSPKKRHPSSTNVAANPPSEDIQVNLHKSKTQKHDVLIESNMIAGKSQQPEPSYPSKVKVTPGNYSVQVASNADKAASDVTLERLEAQGFHGFVQPALVNEKHYYRVRLGPVNSKEQATELREKLLKTKGIKDAIIAKE